MVVLKADIGRGYANYEPLKYTITIMPIRAFKMPELSAWGVVFTAILVEMSQKLRNFMGLNGKSKIYML